ncbi:MAG: ParA family protein [Planctomycetales bacterium]
MAVYAIWNNKGGVGKSYLTFQVSCEYARTHPNEKVLVVDLCPQADSSSMLLGGMENGENQLEKISAAEPRRTVAGYIRERVTSPYQDPHVGGSYIHQVHAANVNIPSNLYLVVGDYELELLAPRVRGATVPGPDDAWARIHRWIVDLINDVKQSWNMDRITVFIDCNPSFGIYTELALSAAERLIIPFSADGSSKRAVRTLLALLYGTTRLLGEERSEFVRNSERFSLRIPEIYCYVGNRLTQYRTSAKAFRTVVGAIGNEIWSIWQTNPGCFHIHPSGASAPTSRQAFAKMFQFEVVDANSASVVSSALGIPIVNLAAGQHLLGGRRITVNQSQLDNQQPNISSLVKMIE